MPTSPISAVTAQSTSFVQSSAPKTEMGGYGESDFMLMLMAQLKNQNPMEPMDDKDLMGQVAQLNSLRELSAISTKMAEMTRSSQAGYASSLIGRYISTSPEDGSTPFQGVVDGMEIVNGEYFLTSGDEVVRLSDVTVVKEQEG